MTDELIKTIRRGWIEVGGRRMCLLDVATGGIYGIRERLDMLVGAEAAGRALYEAGDARIFTEGLIEAGLIGRNAAGFRASVEAYAQAGFGDFSVEELDVAAGRATIACPDAFEGWAYRENGRRTDYPVCDYSCGVLAGFLRAIAEDEALECVERTCLGQGDERCTFAILPRAQAPERTKKIEQLDLARELVAKVEQLEAQQAVIQELTTPVIRVWQGILTLPIVGAIDSPRAARITEDLLERIVETQARVVILDITGVPLVDTGVANRLLKTIRAASLLGARCLLVGIRPEIAQTVVHLGVDLSGIETYADLQSGLERAFGMMGLQVGSK